MRSAVEKTKQGPGRKGELLLFLVMLLLLYLCDNSKQYNWAGKSDLWMQKSIFNVLSGLLI